MSKKNKEGLSFVFAFGHEHNQINRIHHLVSYRDGYEPMAIGNKHGIVAKAAKTIGALYRGERLKKEFAGYADQIFGMKKSVSGEVVTVTGRERFNRQFSGTVPVLHCHEGREIYLKAVPQEEISAGFDPMECKTLLMIEIGDDESIIRHLLESFIPTLHGATTVRKMNSKGNKRRPLAVAA